MLFEEGKKEEFIEKLNQNYRTILSYGNDGLVPVGEFIIKDIREDNIPKEYSSRTSDFKLANIILTKIDDETVQIVLPMTTFLTKYSELSKTNADKLSIGSDLSLSLQDVERRAESKVISDDTLKELVDAETISLEESDADYIINGEIQSTNYSICPVNLGKYRERIREKSNDKENDEGKTAMSDSYKTDGGIERGIYEEQYER